jgi:hypothetical protein
MHMRLGISINSVIAVAGLSTLALNAGATAQVAPPRCGVSGAQQWLATRPSPLDSATLVLHGKIAVICYSRPSLRGRSLDTLLPDGLAWRTGANEPTTLLLTDALNVGGAALAAGRYVILTVPNRDRWTLVFHTTPDSEPAKMYRSLSAVGQGVGRVEHHDRVAEQFTIGTVSDSTGAAFIFDWGDRRVRVPVRTP